MKLNLIENFSHYLSTVYNQIQELTKMNIDIYKSIEGVIKND